MRCSFVEPLMVWPPKEQVSKREMKMKVGDVIPSLSLSLFPISFLLSFCEWMWMGQTNTTFMEMASCALKSNGAAGEREEEEEEEGDRRREKKKEKSSFKGRFVFRPLRVTMQCKMLR